MTRSFPVKLATITILTICIAVIGFLALPFLIDILVLPKLLAKTPFSYSQASMGRITPYQVSGSIELENRDEPALSIPRFKLQFTPQSLLQKSIETLTLDQAALHLYKVDGRWVMPGLERQPSASDKAPTDAVFFFPVKVKTVVLKGCQLILHDPRSPDLHVGISAQIKPVFRAIENGHSLVSLSGSFQFFDDFAATASLTAAVENDELQVQTTVDNAVFDLPGEIVPLALKGLRFKGVFADLDLTLDSRSLSLRRYALSGRVEGLHFSNETVTLSGGGSDEAAAFSFDGDMQSHTYKISALAVAAPVGAEVDISGTGTYKDEAIETSGTIDASLTPPEDSGTKIPLSLAYKGRWSPEGFQLSTAGNYHADQPLVLFDGSLSVGLEELTFYTKIHGADEDIQAELQVDSGPVNLDHEKLKLATSAMKLSGTLNRVKDQTSLRLTGAAASLEIPEKKLGLENIKFSLPISVGSSGSAAEETGNLTIGSIAVRDEQLFSFSSSFRQSNSLYSGDGAVKLLVSPDATIPFTAEASPAAKTGNISWNLDPVDVGPESLPDFITVPTDLDFASQLAAHGRIRFADGRMSAQAQVDLSGTTLELSDKNFKIEDVTCSLEFPELPSLHSSPSQRCAVGSIDMSSLHFSDGEIFFRLEDQQTIFVEKSKIHWCGGTLETGSLRLSAERPEIDTIFYCSRIRLGELLEQFGFAGTEGEGSLNGRLPLKFSRDSIQFDEGFLFSTPGTGGIVRFTDTDLLRQGMGAVSEAGYISYSLKALEDFTYNWTKLTFDSDNNDLLLTLELDGKPSNPLPFKFNKNGMIIESEQGQGLQYPIRLDVNFRLPLVELFQVGQSINSIMGNNQ